MKNAAKTLQSHLMTATSYMIPFVVAGGILFAVSIMLNGEASVPTSGWLAQLNQIGSAGLALFIPVLGGYIAFSIADKPGLAPGFIGAYLAREIGAGFIGGIVAGFIAGYAIKLLEKIKLPSQYRTLKTIFIYPLGATLITGGLIVFVIGGPIAWFMTWLTNWLNSLSGIAKVPLGVILGAMVGVDMGGPINKVAYTFAQTQVDTLPYLMGGVGAVGAVPPIGIGLATLIFKKRFTQAERDQGFAAILMGCMGITEGAIPYATADLKIIPMYVAGSATACATAFMCGCLNHAPWGGLIVLPVVDHRLAYFLSVMLGAAVVVALVGIFKKAPVDEETHGAVEDEDIELNFETF